MAVTKGSKSYFDNKHVSLGAVTSSTDKTIMVLDQNENIETNETSEKNVDQLTKKFETLY